MDVVEQQTAAGIGGEIIGETIPGPQPEREGTV